MKIPQVALDAFRSRLTAVFPAQIVECLNALDDAQIWMRPNAHSNSIGNIVLHLTGSLRHFVVRGLGGAEFQRDRPAEFSATKMPREELIARFEAMVADVGRTLDGIAPERLSEPSTEPKMFATVYEDLLNATVHLANHAGQIVWITKSLQAQPIPGELWMTTHRRHGGWKEEAK